MKIWLKNNWFRACFALAFLIFAFSFGYNFLIRTQPNPVIFPAANSNIQTSNQLTGLINLQDLISSLAASNLAYLTIALVIIGFLAGAFYIFNFKPLQDQLTRQELKNDASEEKIQKLKEDVKTLLKKLETTNIKNENGLKALEKELALQIDKRIFSAEEKIAKLSAEVKTEINGLQIDAYIQDFMVVWNEHYMWHTSKTYENEWSSLVGSLEKSLKFEKKFGSYFALPMILKTLFGSIDKLKDSVSKESFEKILDPLSKIKGFEAERAEITQKIFGLNS